MGIKARGEVVIDAIDLYILERAIDPEGVTYSEIRELYDVTSSALRNHASKLRSMGFVYLKMIKIDGRMIRVIYGKPVAEALVKLLTTEEEFKQIKSGIYLKNEKSNSN